MASVTTYTCDRCAKESTDNGFLHQVSIVVRKHYGECVRHGQEWCSECITSVGIELPSVHGRSNDTAPIPQPTIEDIIREIVRSELP